MPEKPQVRDPRRIQRRAPEPIRVEQRHPLLAIGGVRTPALLRRMVALREVLDPPVALRQRDVWDRLL